MKELCMANTWFYKADKKKITSSAGGCETEIDFVLAEEKYRKYIRDVNVIPWELQHRLVVIDLDKTVLKKIVRKQQITRKIWKLNENRTRVRFEKRVPYFSGYKAHLKSSDSSKNRMCALYSGAPSLWIRLYFMPKL